MTAPLPSRPSLPTASQSTMIAADWIRDRLIEARGILADTAQHPNSLVVLAARVVAGHTDSSVECSDALDVLQQLDRRRLHVIAADAFPNGGAR